MGGQLDMLVKMNYRTFVGGEVRMAEKTVVPRFQQVIETVEALPPDDQLLLIEIIQQRLIQYRRAELASEVAKGQEAYHRGAVRRGTVDDLMEDLAE